MSGSAFPARRPRLARAGSSLALVAVLSLLLAAAPGSAAARRPIAETDLLRFVWVADPQISPDGSHVVFVRVTVDEKEEGYDTSLWIVPADGSEAPRAFTAGRRDSSPRWSPDGRSLAFLRAVEKEGETSGFGKAQVYLIPAGGGEAAALTELPHGAGAPAWSPDGRALAFTSTSTDRDLEQERAKREDKGKGKKGAAKDEERESDVRVITRAVYRWNGQGFLDPKRPPHLWTVAVPRGAGKPAAPRRVTSGPFEEENPVWSPDGSRLYFVATRVAEPYYAPRDSDLFSVPVASGDPPGEVRPEVSIEGEIGDFAFSPDGRQIAFVGTPIGAPERSYDQPDVFVASLSGARPGAAARNLTTAYDYDVAESLSGDQKPPRGDRPAPVVWSADGRSLVVYTAERGRVNLVRIDVASGRVEPLTRGDQEVVAYTASRDGARLALVVSTAVAVGDLFALEPASGRLQQLTRFNEPLFAEIEISPPSEITYKSFDGREIHAWVQRPVGFREGRRYPLILNVHGGPHAAYGHTFDHEFHWMAAKGYLVLYPNPRGSSSYGQEFGNVIQYHYPGDDHEDLMAGVDELIRRGWADPERLGVTGGSGGGVLTGWAITRTDRFKAAVSQRSIADWSSFWYTADFSLFTRMWFKGAPWEDPEDFAARSAITYAPKIKTPLMLIEGESDDRTPAGAGGEQMFRALKYLKKPTVMVRFPGETHELSRSGKPWHRIERLRHMVAWFDKYLQGKDDGGVYEVP